MQRAEQAVDVTQRSIVTVVEDWTGDDVTRRSIVTVVEGWTRVNVTQRSIVTVVFFFVYYRVAQWVTYSTK